MEGAKLLLNIIKLILVKSTSVYEVFSKVLHLLGCDHPKKLYEYYRVESFS